MIMAMIRPETEMKDSGIEWIGDIPESWTIRPLKSLYTLTTGFTPNSKDDSLYDENGETWVTIGDLKGDIIYNSKQKISKKVADMHRAEMTKQGSLMYSFKLSVGTVAVAGKDLFTNEAIASFLPKNRHGNLHYLKYASSLIIGNANTNIYGAFIMNQQLILNAPLPLPSLDEQQAIADYLDETCSKIDEIIAEANASVEEYKELKQSVIDNATMTGIHDSEMKNTDYVWFPEMPKSWDLVLASLLFREDVRPVDANDVSLSLSQVDGLIPTDDMSERSLKSATHDNWKHVIPDDLVLNRFKGHLGVFFASKYTGMVSFHYGVYHAIRDDVYAKYYEYLFHSTTYKNIFALKSNGITVGLQNLSNGNFYSVKILHPTLDEQIEIVKFLDKRIAEIDSLIAEKESLINDLEAYKKSLIYEVVTGKRRVV